MNIQNYLKEKAKKEEQTIVLAEGNDPRIIQAAEKIQKENIADIIILGDSQEISNLAADHGVNINDLNIINPLESKDLLNEFTSRFYKLRKHKGISREEAKSIVEDPLYFGTMMVKTDKAQGMVAGARNLTSDVIRPSLQIIKTRPGISIVSGAFLIQVPESDYGTDGVFVYADCGVTPNPDSEQLAEIAISAADTANNLLDLDPIVGMLSFSTKGSAEHELVDKVRDATETAQNKREELKIEGELQLDAAIVPEVAAKKAPDSELAGKANVLIFPDLQAGNIGYKLTQRLAGAEAYGPILQGLDKPVNDLSRGCSVEDIVNVVSVTAIQYQNTLKVSYSV